MQTQPPPNKQRIHPIERALVVLAAAACIFLTIGLWRSISVHEGLWPLPGLYFVELPGAAIATALAFLRDDPSSVMIAWVSSGIFTAFSILSAFSIGLFYLPIALMFIMQAVLATARQSQSFLRGLGGFAIAWAAQALFMFVFINLLVLAQGASK